MKIGIFGGSFDPVHQEHVRLVKAAIRKLGLDRVFVVPSYVAPHKTGGANASGDCRLGMAKLAFRNVPKAEVSDFEIASGGTSYTYLTVRHFAELFPDAGIYLLMGLDMLENFPEWKNPEDILARAQLAVALRGDLAMAPAAEAFSQRFGKELTLLPFRGKEVSSTQIRIELAFGRRPAALDGKVFSYLKKEGLYMRPAVLTALGRESAERRKHSFRVALMACERAKSLGIPEEKALLAAALHDCAKSVPLSSPLLAGFDIPQGIPAPVMHQFTGAYLAEHVYGVTDGEVLDAIRYHTSGRAGMGTLEKLIFLSDLLEQDRDFAGISKLRELFSRDLDACFLGSLALQIDHLRSKGGEICPLTEQAFEWEKRRQITKN